MYSKYNVNIFCFGRTLHEPGAAVDAGAAVGAEAAVAGVAVGTGAAAGEGAAAGAGEAGQGAPEKATGHRSECKIESRAPCAHGLPFHFASLSLCFFFSCLFLLPEASLDYFNNKIRAQYLRFDVKIPRTA